MILAGVRVVELAAWVAGPAAAGVMADWGADVIKVEPAAGDPQRSDLRCGRRRRAESVPPFELDNRGKRSVMLDLRGRGRPRGDGAAARGRRRVRHEHARRRAGPPRPRPDRPSASGTPAWSTGSSPATASTVPTPTGPATTSARSGPARRSRRRSCHPAICRRRSAAVSATTSPG